MLTDARGNYIAGQYCLLHYQVSTNKKTHDRQNWKIQKLLERNSRTETQNAMNPESADALQEAFLEFEKGEGAAVAVYWGEGGPFVQVWTWNILPCWKGVTLLENWTFLRMAIQSEEQLGQVDCN